MTDIGWAFILMALALVVCMLIYPLVLNFAIRHRIVDNPNARKLQRVPIPVMGGTAVFIGMLVAMLVGVFILKDSRILLMLLLLFVMYITGVWDDVRDVSPYIRFLVEILVVWMAIALLDIEIDDLHGLWGIWDLPQSVSIPLSIIAGVGIINAVNLIDGVDGYCSFFGIWACFAFALVFSRAGDTTMLVLTFITLGALIPFFFHNVFGRTSKMFLGDGGSLMLGTVLTLFTFSTLSSNSPCSSLQDDGLSLVAVTLAILAIPVFDTIKVMIWRVVRGFSPFRADKTHLHHIFIEMEFSHLATSFVIVMTNVLIGVLLLVVWCLGATIDWQVYIVIVVSTLLTFGYYFYMDRQCQKRSAFFRRMCACGLKTHLSLLSGWRFIAKVVDSRFLAGKTSIEEGRKARLTVRRPDPRIHRDDTD